MSGMFTTDPERLTTLDEIHEAFLDRRLSEFIEYNEQEQRLEGYHFVIESEWAEYDTLKDDPPETGEWEAVMLVPKRDIEGIVAGSKPYLSFHMFIVWKEGGKFGRPVN
jgi:hypothetical protein